MSIKNDEKYFVRNVKNYMVENKISNGKMAKKMGVSTSNVTSTLNGTFDISMNFVRRVSEATGMSIAQLFSPDPKQFGEAVEGDVQDGNAVAMMDLMKKQMKELKEENERLSDENEARLEDVKYMEKRLDESQQARIEIEGNLRKHIAELEKKNEPVKFDKWNLFVDSTDCTGIIDIGGDQIEVYEVAGIDPYDKKVLVKLYFDEITIK